MKIMRIALAVVVLGVVAGLAYVAQQAEPAGGAMAVAAQKFLGSLTPEQRARAVFPYDSKERTNFNFVPLEDKATKKSTRKGLPLVDMTDAQKKAALALVRAGTSKSGDVQATTIMSLEAILKDQEKGKGPVRNPEWYFFTVFGDPSKTAKWGWRVEGHHLSLNFALDGTQVLAATPAFYGANPAEVKSGDRKGLRILAPTEDLARQLFKSLTDDQKKVALKDKPFPEITQKTIVPPVGNPVGLAAAKMTAEQKDILVKLLHAYTDRMPPDVAEVEMKHVKEAGIDKIHFAYSGGTELGQGRTYRVQGPTFVIEFINLQNDSGGNPANHIHSVWRRMKGDFGLN